MTLNPDGPDGLLESQLRYWTSLGFDCSNKKKHRDAWDKASKTTLTPEMIAEMGLCYTPEEYKTLRKFGIDEEGAEEIIEVNSSSSSSSSTTESSPSS